jgi:hypothetical protein
MSKGPKNVNKEVATTQNKNEIANMMAAWGGEAIEAQDTLIPKILLMQSLSEFVVDGKAQPGDLVDSVSGDVLAAKNKPFEVIPISMFKTMVIEKFNGSKWEYEASVPFAPGDAKLPWEFEEAGEKYRRNTVLNFYVLRADQAAQPDALPYVVSFRRTSTKAGKVIATHFLKASMSKVPPASKTIILASKSEKGDQGPYQVFQAQEGRKTANEEMLAAYRWFQQIQKGMTKVDESDLKSGTETATAASDGPAY